MRHQVNLVAGVALGLVVGLWQIISIAAGLTAVFVPVAFALQVLAVVAALWTTQAEHRYGQQVLGAVQLSAVASVLIFVGSLVATSVLFPDAIPELRAATATRLAQAGASPSEIAAATGGITPIGEATAGVIGTMISGPLIGAIGAIWLRSTPA